MIRLNPYKSLSGLLLLITAQYAAAQMSSVQDKLFKLAPYKNVCPNTYRSLELNQEANKLANQGALVSYDKNQEELAQVLPKAMAETRTGSPCCQALAKIGYPCGGTGGTQSNTSGSASNNQPLPPDIFAIQSAVDQVFDKAEALKEAAQEADISEALAGNLENASERLKKLFEGTGEEHKAAAPSPLAGTLQNIETTDAAIKAQRAEMEEFLREWARERQRDAELLAKMEKELDILFLGMVGDLLSTVTRTPFDINKYIFGSGLFDNFYTSENIALNTLLANSLRQQASSVVANQLLKPWLQLPIGPKITQFSNRSLTFSK